MTDSTRMSRTLIIVLAVLTFPLSLLWLPFFWRHIVPPVARREHPEPVYVAPEPEPVYAAQAPTYDYPEAGNGFSSPAPEPPRAATPPPRDDDSWLDVD